MPGTARSPAGASPPSAWQHTTDNTHNEAAITRTLGGLWIAFIGWFLESASSSSYRQLALKEVLRGQTAGEVMTTDCPLIEDSLTVENLVYDYFVRTNRRCFPVVSNGQVLGLMTLHNVKEVPRDRWPQTPVREAMTPLDELKHVGRDTPLLDVLEVTTAEDINQVVVVERGRFLGMVTRGDILGLVHTQSELGV